ncbi:hypothetical protein UFOVP1290_602 [uncultured Caudovirales phage]|uniref:Uncharacterized protein n=1 Tax=uncultured Caudovirales phage TaxID=2100421 RepID=A0A6J5RLZ8_9CAUD|nr:hypothetical protein UFOVP1290_602 [uncultured Caudovirales phage]
MRISEMLQAIASWLESPDNEAMLLAEANDECMKVVSESCVLAAALIKNAAEEVDSLEPPEESNITPESIDGLANLAHALESSGDPALQKQASVIDELILGIAAPQGSYKAAKAAEDYRLEELKKKYEQPRKDLADTNKIADSEKAIEKSNFTKQYKILEAPLSSRYCPDHPGVQIARIGEHVWQCELDKKAYDFDNGFILNNGSKVPGGDVSQQTQGLDTPSHSIFDTREGRLQANK